ncbi:hypothetical protein BFJ65_g6320 [Fusarium oxysporum f. sp. cepae]|uniref:Velvet domain-containing protein n=1 Tax=Fusarium oxysporum f. sp. cepae TaxID=396571 RepID=A0A3L6NM40_FUSOX|nr:hypothetical protein BFJ65_g6320 [Fusarium oxysporum f. sp. cepae]
MEISSVISLNDGVGRRSARFAVNDKLSNAEYSLRFRQQPLAARSCGFADKDRRVIDPPPIIQLTIKGTKLTPEEIGKQLRNNHYVVSCSLYDESGSQDATFMTEQRRQERQLLGTLVSTPFFGKDEHGKEGCFFCFPDLSCRSPGLFRLKFRLTEIDPTRAREVQRFPELAVGNSGVFTVYTPKYFPGMTASTKLVKCLKEQGCVIPIKQGNRLKNARSHDRLDDEK